MIDLRDCCLGSSWGHVWPSGYHMTHLFRADLRPTVSSVSHRVNAHQYFQNHFSAPRAINFLNPQLCLPFPRAQKSCVWAPASIIRYIPLIGAAGGVSNRWTWSAVLSMTRRVRSCTTYQKERAVGTWETLEPNKIPDVDRALGERKLKSEGGQGDSKRNRTTD